MRIPFSKLLYFPFILSGSFLFNYPVNANLQDSYKSQRPCTWDTAQYKHIDTEFRIKNGLAGTSRYCVQPKGNIIEVEKFQHQSRGNTIPLIGKLNRIEKSYNINYEWKIEGNKLVRYTCPSYYSTSLDCSGEIKKEVLAIRFR